MQKHKVAVIYGGQSAEHEVSVMSAANVVDALGDRYEVTTIGIDKNGKWHQTDGVLENIEGREVNFLPGHGGVLYDTGGKEKEIKIDIVFPVLHGPYGEDGTVQGFLEIVGVPYVGARVTGSSVGMDKDVMKRLFKEAGLPVTNHVVVRDGDTEVSSPSFPVFVKPANMGSSVGITKVNDEKDLKSAINEALKFDDKVLVEEGVEGREIECSVLGNSNPEVSVPGEIVYSTDFYSYDSKYKDGQGTKLVIPADLSTEKADEIREIARKAFVVAVCSGMARVDLFLKEDGTVLLNEINTIPGFTHKSMYPMLWKESGLSYEDLVDKLLSLALENFDK